MWRKKESKKKKMCYIQFKTILGGETKPCGRFERMLFYYFHFLNMCFLTSKYVWRLLPTLSPQSLSTGPDSNKFTPCGSDYKMGGNVTVLKQNEATLKSDFPNNLYHWMNEMKAFFWFDLLIYCNHRLIKHNYCNRETMKKEDEKWW